MAGRSTDIPCTAAEAAVKQQLSRLVETNFEEELTISNGGQILKNLRDIDASSSQKAVFEAYTVGIPDTQAKDATLRHIILLVSVLRDPRCAKQEGLFRLGANKKDVLALYSKVQAGKALDYVAIGAKQSVHLLTSLLKHLLVNWKQSVLTYAALPLLRKMLEIKDEHKKRKAFQLFLLGLNNNARTALQAIVGMLHQVHTHAEENMMTAQNLARCISPSLVSAADDDRIPSPMEEAQLVCYVNEVGRYLIQTGVDCFSAPDGFAEAFDRCIKEEIVHRYHLEQEARQASGQASTAATYATATAAHATHARCDNNSNGEGKHDLHQHQDQDQQTHQQQQHEAPLDAGVPPAVAEMVMNGKDVDMTALHLGMCDQWREKLRDAIDTGASKADIKAFRERLIDTLQVTAELLLAVAGKSTEERQKLEDEADLLRRQQPSRLKDLRNALASTPRRARKALSRLATPRTKRRQQAYMAASSASTAEDAEASSPSSAPSLPSFDAVARLCGSPRREEDNGDNGAETLLGSRVRLHGKRGCGNGEGHRTPTTTAASVCASTSCADDSNEGCNSSPQAPLSQMRGDGHKPERHMCVEGYDISIDSPCINAGLRATAKRTPRVARPRAVTPRPPRIRWDAAGVGEEDEEDEEEGKEGKEDKENIGDEEIVLVVKEGEGRGNGKQVEKQAKATAGVRRRGRGFQSADAEARTEQNELSNSGNSGNSGNNGNARNHTRTARPATTASAPASRHIAAAGGGGGGAGAATAVAKGRRRSAPRRVMSVRNGDSHLHFTTAATRTKGELMARSKRAASGKRKGPACAGEENRAECASPRLRRGAHARRKHDESLPDAAYGSADDCSGAGDCGYGAARANQDQRAQEGDEPCKKRPLLQEGDDETEKHDVLGTMVPPSVASAEKERRIQRLNSRTFIC